MPNAKKTVIFLLSVLLCLSMLPAALADTPRPIPVLNENEIRPTPQGIHHYMLICMDSWNAKQHFNDKEPGHTDGLILVTVDEYAGRVMLTSFIRDMLIQRPDGDFGRINNIMGFFNETGKNRYSGKQGIEYLISTINSHFDLRIEDYIVVDFQQVENIINAIGGIDIKITAREANYLVNYSISASSTTPAITGAGTYHFSGHAAVIYMRIRKVANIEGETQDVGRTRRARTVLTSIAEKLSDISYDEAEALLEVVIDNTVLSNMSTVDMLEALDLALEMQGTEVEGIRMPIDGTYEPMPVAGMATQQIDYIANREALWDFFLDSTVILEDDDEW